MYALKLIMFVLIWFIARKGVCQEVTTINCIEVVAGNSNFKGRFCNYFVFIYKLNWYMYVIRFVLEFQIENEERYHTNN